MSVTDRANQVCAKTCVSLTVLTRCRPSYGGRDPDAGRRAHLRYVCKAPYMVGKHDLQEWIVAALRAKGGAASQLEVAKFIWAEHAQDLESSGDLFYTWQYDYRWEAQKLRDRGVLRPKFGQRGGPWELA